MSGAPLLLLDTHIWIWWIEQDRRLPEPIRRAIESSETSVFVSAVSVYELSVLVHRNRIRLTQDVEYWVQQATDGADIFVVSVDQEIARIAGLLPAIHGDPLDRLLIATACCLDAQVASLDEKFRAYPQLNGRLILQKLKRADLHIWDTTVNPNPQSRRGIGRQAVGGGAIEALTPPDAASPAPHPAPPSAR